ncbi:MAG: hypothetical protein ABSA63_08480 [Thermoplasmata archaeon]|jgi:hypothetical protein
MTSWPGPEYRVTTVLRVPLAFAYRWCTDFRPDDAQREGETYERRVLEQSSWRVVYEDLESTPTGWRWARHSVVRKPPNRWHSDSTGNYRDARLDYALTSLGPERTRFTLVWRRRPSVLAGRRPSKKSIELSTLRAWRTFAKAMESDYRQGRRR